MHHRLSLFLAAYLCVSVPVAAAVDPRTAELLAADLADMRNLSADFVQTRTLENLGVTLSFSGGIVLEKGGRLMWRVDEPLAYICIISAEGLTQWDGESGREQHLSAASMPWLSALYENLSGWLSGDLEKLEAQFEVEQVGERRFSLTPKDELFKRVFESAELTFHQPPQVGVKSFVIAEKGGDRMEIEFSKCRKNSEIPPEAWLIPPK